MPAEDRFDMVVIGSGPAGEKAAAQAAYFGKRVAVVERSSAPGGAAVSNAGIPTKTLRETALYITGFRRREVYGLGLTLDPEATVTQLRTRTAQVIKTMTDAVRLNLERHAVELVHGAARLGADRTVHVTTDSGRERVLHGDVVLIATGSRPFRPPGVPFDDPDVHDSETVLEIDHPFSSLVVVGGGAVGCEYASIFTALGYEVTLIDAGKRLLPFLDAEISQLLAQAFSEMGMRLVLGGGRAAVTREEKALCVALGSGEHIRPDKVLFASGRVGNSEGLRLEDAGVAVDGRNRIVVDERFRTTAESIYAAGDVVGPPGLQCDSDARRAPRIPSVLARSPRAPPRAEAPSCRRPGRDQVSASPRCDSRWKAFRLRSSSASRPRRTSSASKRRSFGVASAIAICGRSGLPIRSA